MDIRKDNQECETLVEMCMDRLMVLELS